MPEEVTELAWNLLVELRKESLEAQRMRTQVIGFKITLVGSGLAVLSAVTSGDAGLNARIPDELLAIPAFASIFFDLLINSYSISIKRIGLYCKTQLEPQLRSQFERPGHVSPPRRFLLWEEFFDRLRVRHALAIFGNIGLTALALVPAFYVLWTTDRPLLRWFIAPLALLTVYDLLAFYAPGRIICPEGPPAPPLKFLSPVADSLNGVVEWLVFGKRLTGKDEEGTDACDAGAPAGVAPRPTPPEATDKPARG